MSMKFNSRSGEAPVLSTTLRKPQEAYAGMEDGRGVIKSFQGEEGVRI